MSEEKTFRRRLEGIVVSDKCEKTIVVKVGRRFKDKKYNKFVNKSKRYHAHDEANTAKEGDRVSIIEARPTSKTKKWALVKVL